jgi:2-polyprenyl-3-methyl-5-hydroxy-6-metoxy-1,4-benzoquinol methylase
VNREELKREYNKFYRRNPNKWSSDKRDEFTYQALLTFLGRAPKSLIDIGCGNGHTLAYLHKHWPETKYTGLDLSSEAIRIARKKAPFATLIQGFLDQEDLNEYQVVCCLGVAEHFEYIVPNLVLIKDLITRNGVAYIEVPNCIGYPTSEPVEGFRRLNIGSHQTEWHLFRPTWEQHLSNAGLEIVQALDGPNAEFIWFVRS